jgi:hypothetical protein
METQFTYLIMFERSREPVKLRVPHSLAFLRELDRLMAEFGPIEWVQRTYR